MRELPFHVEYDRYSIEVWLQEATETEVRQIAEMVFPPGSLPDDTSFATRELEIIKQLIWQTADIQKRIEEAQFMAASRRMSATFSA